MDTDMDSSDKDNMESVRKDKVIKAQSQLIKKQAEVIKEMKDKAEKEARLIQE